MLQAEAKAQRALARSAETRAECNEQHQVMEAELEAMQSPVKSSLRATNQQHTVQSSKVDAMGYHLEEMKDLFLLCYLVVTAPKPSVYRGSKEGSLDGWILVMRGYLQRTHSKATPDGRASSVT